jgi:hypothetical protein
MVRKMEKVNIYGLTELSIRENGKTTRLQVMDTINGQMAGNIWDIGKAISWMILECIPGKMGECMKDSTKTIRNMVMGCTHGQIKSATKVGGLRVNSMVLASSFPKRVRERVGYGKKERKFVGSQVMKQN